MQYMTGLDVKFIFMGSKLHMSRHSCLFAERTFVQCLPSIALQSRKDSQEEKAKLYNGKF